MECGGLSAHPSLLRAPGVPVTRLHRAATDLAHPAAAVPGHSRGEAGGGQQRTESPSTSPGEAGEVGGGGLCWAFAGGVFEYVGVAGLREQV